MVLTVELRAITNREETCLCLHEVVHRLHHRLDLELQICIDTTPIIMEGQNCLPYLDAYNSALIQMPLW